MKELESVYESLGKLDEVYGAMLPDCAAERDILLISVRAQVYSSLMQLEKALLQWRPPDNRWP